MSDHTSFTGATGRLWSASAIAEPFSQSLRDDIESRVQSGKARPRLVGILATRSAPSIAYSEWTQKACASVGIDFRVWKTWSEDVSSVGEAPTAVEVQEYNLEADVEDLIIAANADPEIHGIMVSSRIRGAIPRLTWDFCVRSTTPSLEVGGILICSKLSTLAKTSKACISATVGTCITTCDGSCPRKLAPLPARILNSVLGNHRNHRNRTESRKGLQKVSYHAHRSPW